MPNIGTVYGGEIDWVNGSLKVTHVAVDMGSLTWNYATSYQYFTASIDEIATSETGETQSIVCEIYKTTATKTTTGWSSAENCTIGQRGGYANLVVKDTAYTDKTVFTTAVTGKKVVYPLATPIEYSLSDLPEIETLKGVNNVWVANENGTIKVLKAWGY